MSKKKPAPSFLPRAGLIANRVLILLLTFALSVTALAQSNSWELGPYRLLTGPSSPPLRVTMNGARGLRSASFVGSVGGIALESVAVPGPSVRGKDIKLSYDKSQKDGNRLSITIGSKVYHPKLPDWMLVPISKYAESPYTACVSLFGEKTTPEYYDIVYHPAFQNTVMGLRLLQADILLIDVGRFWDLPKFNGRMVVGLGEAKPKGTAWRSSASEIQSVVKRAKFQSWVLTDHGVTVSFNLNKDSFMLSGEPYYHFWIAEPQGGGREPRVVEVRSVTEGMKAKRSALRKLNPVVWNAVVNTMQYAAFFRYMKRNKPAVWSSFLNQVQRVPVLPRVKTPTRWKRSA